MSHSVSHEDRVLVLPRAKDMPAFRGEGSIDRTVAGHVPVEFGKPVIDVRLR